MYKHVATAAAMLFVHGAQASGQVTFTKDVAPVVFRRCVQCHHGGGPTPIDLTTYSSARPHAAQMARVTKARAMPPWKVEPGGERFVDLDPLSDAEINIFQRWFADGAREGDRRAMPSAFAQGATAGGLDWQRGVPDLVLAFPESYLLPAGGTDRSRVFVLPIPLEGSRYVRGIEFRADNRAIHHANIRIDPTPASHLLDEEDPRPGYDGIILRSARYPDGHFLGWTPGQAAPLLPKGLAWTLTPNSHLVVQLHLVPQSTAQLIRPTIALYFTDEPPARVPVMLRLSNQDIEIPAGSEDHLVTDSFVLPVDIELLAVQPHAHYLARHVLAVATLPDGTSRTLLEIRDWDMHWQHVFRYEQPIALPRGTTVAMRYRYDNSPRNRRKPAGPPAAVRGGQQSREEMGDLWLQAIPRDPRDRQLLDDTIRAKWMSTDVIGLESLIEREPERTALRDDVGVLYLELNRPAEAVRHFAATVRLKPASAPAHFNYGTALAASGRVEEAVRAYRRALEIRPGYAVAHNNLGTALLQLAQPAAALESFREAARVDPQLADAHLNAGLVARSLGDYAEAHSRLRRAVELTPGRVVALSSLASILAAAPDASVRNGAEAARFAEQAATLTERRDANTLDVLAVAYASAGQFDRAVEVADEALGLKPSGSLASMIRAHRELFVRRLPYVSPK
jgi:tetratricopeptide (TPR) repeat protein